jgi:acetyl coenzyme A synthetase (ADP forming)-like protein
MNAHALFRFMKHRLEPVFFPRAIAVIGASRHKEKVGYAIMHNLVVNEYQGTLYPINPNAENVHSVKCYPSISDVPGPVDLAIVVVPAAYVLEVMEECGKKGVKGAVVITAGFKETGGKGETLERQLRAVVRKHGIAMIGPNCMGIINTHKDVQMDATFAPTPPLPGYISFMSQSGALGVGILDHATSLKLGINQFVSLGNKADVSGNDLLDYWRQDPNTKIILMYIENVGNPGNFLKIARTLTKRKPVIAVKSGKTEAGAKAALSHTASLAGSDVAVDALFHQCGVIRVDTIEELFDMAMAFSHQRLPKGKRVALVTDAGGPGIMATDVLVSMGMEIAHLKQDTLDEIRKHVVDEAIVSNPVDLTAHGNPDSYGHALDAVLRDDGVDSALAIFVPPLPHEEIPVAQAIWQTAKRHSKPVLCCFLTKNEESPGFVELVTNNIPAFLFPESAATALATMTRYAEYLKRDEGSFKRFKVQKSAAAKIIKSARDAGGQRVREKEALDLFKDYGFDVAKSLFAKNKEDALKCAKNIGYPVVVKAVGPKLIHKTEFKAVAVNIKSERALKATLNEMCGRFKSQGVETDGFLVQEMIKGGMECILGMKSHKHFGHLLAFGLGGIFVEYLKDVSFALAPATDTDAKRMIQSIKTYPLLQGARGGPAMDEASLQDAILRLSQLVEEQDGIEEIDVNPLIVLPDGEGCKVVDARIILQ